ncbi:MAG: hypothetical protein ACYTGZ_03085 [Planctomycetota bacterium]
MVDVSAGRTTATALRYASGGLKGAVVNWAELAMDARPHSIEARMGSTWSSRKLGATGEFEFHSLLPGEYALSWESRFGRLDAGVVRIAGGREKLLLKYDVKSVRLRGQILQDGEPIASGTVTIQQVVRARGMNHLVPSAIRKIEGGSFDLGFVPISVFDYLVVNDASRRTLGIYPRSAFSGGECVLNCRARIVEVRLPRGVTFARASVFADEDEREGMIPVGTVTTSSRRVAVPHDRTLLALVTPDSHLQTIPIPPD